ncbi:ATP-binding protein [Anaeromyxobacter paludicola]|uniref:4Fe-4S ferredoxin n=1 Tax=Anaeromyxobacter paludicola TaxID=2918171 RepID=A0ABM7XA45_9BACT|nr:4Fe-4S binding protein [Anaeromyxobacter paludicola]BDG08710.1 4Fe-4S ferredoxin [Anaeromyxobacter paludicola]
MIRKIVQIDEAKCDGCGQCIPSCAEGAIQLVDGKARLSADQLCDGLGACLGECPQGAITVIEREAEAFDEEAVEAHLAAKEPPPAPVAKPRASLRLVPTEPAPAGGGCPGARTMTFVAPASAGGNAAMLPPPPGPGAALSQLGQWPVQLHLVPTRAPYFAGADLLVAADCVPFAYARFHEDFLAGKRLVVGCPKLDDLQAYVAKLTQIFAGNSIRSVTVLRMEVPCCGGISMAARQALAQAGKVIPFQDVVIGVQGDVKS